MEVYRVSVLEIYSFRFYSSFRGLRTCFQVYRLWEIIYFRSYEHPNFDKILKRFQPSTLKIFKFKCRYNYIKLLKFYELLIFSGAIFVFYQDNIIYNVKNTQLKMYVDVDSWLQGPKVNKNSDFYIIRRFSSDRSPHRWFILNLKNTEKRGC